MITVFTPAYNRAYTIGKLYQSLKEQTDLHFEWLVVDDGSTDNTSEIIHQFMDEGKIDIRYVYQKNGGKHRAINRGVQEAKGEAFFIVDSDDYLPSDAIERIACYFEQIKDNEHFAGVSGNKLFPDKSVVGGDVNYNVLDTDAISIRERYHVKGDMAEVYKTSVLKQYPFPEFEGERFMTEGYVWGQIALKYQIRYFNEGIYICDYLTDGLTKNIRKHHRMSPLGTMLCYASIARMPQYSCLSRIKAAINYWRYTTKIPHSFRREEFDFPAWGYVFYPFGWMFYLYDVYRENK